MDQKERVEIIRKGNELFNAGRYDEAEKLFVAASYRDGLTRLGDYHFYDRRRPLEALKYYQMVNRQDRIDEILERMVFALGRLMGQEPEEQKVELPPLKVSPKLKILAEEILREQGETLDDEVQDATPADTAADTGAAP